MTTQNTHFDIVIAGGGMVGLCLAHMLAFHGAASRIAVIEPTLLSLSGAEPYRPSFDTRSTALSSGSVKLLKTAGLWRGISQHAQEITEVQVSDKGRPGFAHFTTAQNVGESLGFVVENQWFGSQLARAIEGNSKIESICPGVLNRVSFNARQVELNVSIEKKEQNYSAGLLVLADGVASPLAAQLGISFDKYHYRQVAFVANVEHSEPHRGSAFERFTEAGPLALLPLETPNRSALVWTHKHERADEVAALEDSEFLGELQRNCGFQLGRFSRISARQCYPLNKIIAKEQVRSRLVLMGNAAHFLHPVAGQGFNLTMRDIVQLAERLAAAGKQGRDVGDLGVLMAYQRDRETDQFLTSEMSHSFIELFMSSSVLSRAARTAALAGIEFAPGLRQLFFHQMMGLGFSGAARS